VSISDSERDIQSETLRESQIFIESERVREREREEEREKKKKTKQNNLIL
jgi:hypothetical protein